MTDTERIELRLECVRIFTEVCSKHELEKGVIFTLAEQAWGFATKPPMGATVNHSGTGRTSPSSTSPLENSR